MVICQNVSAASYDNQDSLPFDADLLRALLGLPSRRGLQLCPVTIVHRNRSYAPGRRTSNCRIIGTRVSVCLHNDSGSLLPAQPRRVGGSGPGSHRPASWLLRGTSYSSQRVRSATSQASASTSSRVHGLSSC